MVEKILNSHKSIIFLNGTFHKSLLDIINTNAPLIAADGAFQKTLNLGLIADYIVGDLDSYNSKFINPKSKIIKVDNQDYTDFEKCILFAKKNNLLPSLVLGINGGEIDHILGNAQTILKRSDNDLYFLDTYTKDDNGLGIKLGIPINNEKLTLNLKSKSTISIIPFDKASITTKGLNWELNNTTLQLDGIVSLRNENISKHIEIEVKKSKALVIIDISNFFY